jgi:hypothetical protein
MLRFIRVFSCKMDSAVVSRVTIGMGKFAHFSPRYDIFAFRHRHKCPGYEPKLEKILRHSKCCKARLLHYFPPEDDRVDDATAADAQFSDWCGWHNDHGSLTGLLPALYLDGDGDVVDPPDPEAGLYIKSRDGRLVRSMIPEGAVAFQVGETAQIHTGGLLKATPHCECYFRVSVARSEGVTSPPVHHSPHFRRFRSRERMQGTGGAREQGSLRGVHGAGIPQRDGPTNR